MPKRFNCKNEEEMRTDINNRLAIIITLILKIQIEIQKYL